MKRETMTRRKKIAAGKGKGAAAGAVQSGSVITTDVVASQQGNAGENMERLLLETESSNGHMIPGVDLLALESDVIDLGSTVEVAAETIHATEVPATDTNVPVEIVKSDSIETVSTEVKYLSNEAFAQRKEDVKNPNLRSIAADHVVKAWAEKLALETNRDLAVNPITLQEYTDYRDVKAAANKPALPKPNVMFTSDAYKRLIDVPDWVREKVYAKFQGREGVTEDEVLIGLAEVRIAGPKSMAVNLKIDGAVEVCINPACPDTNGKKFVPMTTTEPRSDGKGFDVIGQFLAVAGKLQPYCFDCRSVVRNAIFAKQRAWR